MLVTLGDPGRLTGGNLYQRHVAAAAPRHGAEIRFVSAPERPFPRTLACGPSVLREALAARPDALLVDSIVTAVMALPLARARPSIPVVGVLHQPPGGIRRRPELNRAQDLLDRRFYRLATRLVVPSQVLAAAVRRAGVAAERIRIVPPGTELPPTSEAAVGPRADARVVLLCVANWLPLKGIHTLLDAFARLPPEAAVLHLAGATDVDPGYGRRMRARLAREDLRGRVVVHGAVPPARLSGLFRAADLFILPSFYESYGMVFAEALAAGLPVLGGRAGNVPALIRDGIDGLLVRPGDVDALAAALRRLVADADLRRRLAAAARERAARLPTWDDTAGGLVAVPRDAIAEGGSTAGREGPGWEVAPSG